MRLHRSLHARHGAAANAAGQEAVLDILTLRPFNFDISFNQRTFAPQARVIAALAGLTALRYGLLEVRTVYQYYSHHTPTFVTDQHSLFLNPRRNNFIDVLDFPKTRPLNRVLRHVLFGLRCVLNQSLINNPGKGDKGFTPEVFE